MKSHPSALSIRIYFRTRQIIKRSYRLIDGVVTGFWLGILDEDGLHQLNQSYYAQHTLYQDDEHNLQGLFDWEEKLVTAHFADCRTILVTSAGGGREVLALRRLGFTVDAFECNPALVEHANMLMAREGLPADILLAPIDQCPDCPRLYDGIVIGWGSYMHIQGREQRVAFLKQLRASARPQAVLLLSSFWRTAPNRRERIVTALANGLRRLRGRPLVNLGDDLTPYFVHLLSQEELASEMLEGGFQMVHFSHRSFGHALGRVLGHQTLSIP